MNKISIKALLVVDVLYDFMPGGSLAVKGGDSLAEPINGIRNEYDFVIFLKDLHPKDHCSFKENGGLWPIHCVDGTRGCEIDNNLIINPVDFVVTKGSNRDVDSYSGFWDNNRKYKTNLSSILGNNNIDEVHIAGIATEYCVKWTALDAAEEGLKTSVILNLCRGIEARDGDVDKAVLEMIAHEINIIHA